MLSTSSSGSARCFSSRAGSVFMVKRRGSSLGPTSLHSSGVEAGAPGTGRRLNGDTSVRPCPFCRKSR